MRGLALIGGIYSSVLRGRGTQSDMKKAIEWLNVSIAHWKKSPNTERLVSAYTAMAQVYEDMGMYKEALRFCDAAQRSAAESAIRDSVSLALTRCHARIALKHGDHNAAARFAKEGISLLLTHTKQLPSEESSVARDLRSDLFDVGVTAAAHMDDVHLVHWMQEQSRATSFRQALANRKSHIESNVPGNHLRSLRAAQGRVREARATFESVRDDIATDAHIAASSPSTIPALQAGSRSAC